LRELVPEQAGAQGPRREVGIAASFLIQLSNSPVPIFVARMERSEIRGLSSRQESRIALRSIRATHELKTRVIAPLSSPARGSPVVLFLLSPRGVRNDRAFHRARGAMCGHMASCAEAHATTNSLGRRSSPAFRTRMDFSACCITDRELSLAPTPPGPCELSHGHALGPSARRVGVNLLSTCGSPTFVRNPQASRPDIVAATASRCHVTMTIATRPLPERDG
jgi:hypothetical protein